MTQGLSESRFYMWRTVFAMAHVDGVVHPQERAMMARYLEAVPFSNQQKTILLEDINEPQNCAEMFSKITEPSDRGEFFQFARLMVWSDGDYAVQEEAIMDQLTRAQMGDLDLGSVRNQLRMTRQASSEWREALEERMRSHAKDQLGIDAILKSMASKERQGEDGLTNSRFHMWRTVFAMAHADRVITPEEEHFMRDVLETVPFSETQKKILENDIGNPRDPAEMFTEVIDQNDRSQFFSFARMLVWSDGDFDKQEQEIITRLNQMHIKNVDFDTMVDDVSLSLEDGDPQKPSDHSEDSYSDDAPKGVRGFLKKLIG